MTRTDQLEELKPTFSPHRLRAMVAAGLTLLVGTVSLPAAESSHRPLLVFAASSMADVLSEIGRDFESAHDVKVRFNFAASSILARQIASGAPADVFLSADEAKMDQLERQEWLVAGSRIRLLGNQLVLIAPVGQSLVVDSFAALARPEVTRIALADPRSVPAGIYAREYLEDIGLWDVVESKVIPLANVRATLSAVESGNVEAGMVYRTDAVRSTRVRVCAVVPLTDGPVIAYPVAQIRRDVPHPMAGLFVASLFEPSAAGVFQRHGFRVLNPPTALPSPRKAELP
ncbi:MAG: molybdate ABC transporter substrate-binding protein [Opitutaceae bacterium]